MRTGRHTSLPYEELKRRARLDHVLDPDEVGRDADTYVDLLDEVMGLMVRPANAGEYLEYEWVFASIITMDLWRAGRNTGGVRQRVQELATADPAEARRRALADADERDRLLELSLQHAQKALVHLDAFRERLPSSAVPENVVDINVPRSRAAG